MVVLVCPLDWGLGHVMRCIPLIDGLIRDGHEVICCGDGMSGEVLKREYPNCKYINLPGYKIEYSTGNSQMLRLLLQVPKIVRGIAREHCAVGEIVREYGVDMVISDNRYGLYGSGAKSIFITHQLNIKTPVKWVSGIINIINHWFINCYDECWVPDIESDGNLSGELSHGGKFVDSGVGEGRIKYIGFLSRFRNVDADSNVPLLGIVSGVEPQRSIFARHLIDEFKRDGRKAEIVLGLPIDEGNVVVDRNLTIYSYLNGNELATKIAGAEMVVCRSGYSTLMDMQVFGKKLKLVPTPGQTEQEYLAKHYENTRI